MMKALINFFLVVFLVGSTAMALAKSDMGFGASSLDLLTVGGMQIGQGGFFARLNQIQNQYDFGLMFANGSNTTSALFGSNIYILQHFDEQKMLKYGPGVWWSTLGGATVFTLQGQVGVEYNPVRDIGIEGVVVPLRVGFGASSTALEFFATRVSVIWYL